MLVVMIIIPLMLMVNGGDGIKEEEVGVMVIICG